MNVLENQQQNQETSAMSSLRVRKLVISAMFLALALVMRTFFSLEIPLFGASGMRIGVTGIFTSVPAILFGPFYGMVVSGLNDFIGHHMRPTGAWIPYITMTAALAGFLRGGLWMLLRNKKAVSLRICVIIFAASALGIGISNSLLLSRDGVDGNFFEQYTLEMSVNAQGLPVRTIVDPSLIDTQNMALISQMAINRSVNAREPNELISEFIMFMTTTMIIIGIFSAALIVIGWAASKFILKERKSGDYIMALLIAMLTAALVQSLLNTFILRFTLPAWQLLPFSLVAIPRAIQSTASTIIITCIVAAIFEMCRHHPQIRKWID
ncbi:MAG: folate family ECF transporter S component [Turicibacter sp.]|nr:folate family ECF transporter S component [Turicibacter sp.]